MTHEPFPSSLLPIDFRQERSNNIPIEKPSLKKKLGGD
jgi:hypothetical protein